jgi:hypothetical protein
MFDHLLIDVRVRAAHMLEELLLFGEHLTPDVAFDGV